MSNVTAFGLGNLPVPPGGRAGCGGCSITICLRSPCGGGPATGVDVTVSGATTATGTTGSDGCVTFTTLAAGSYTIDTSGNPRYNNFSGSETLACGATKTINLTASSGYFCAGGCFAEPIPRTLTFTCDGTPVTVTEGSGIFSFTATKSVGNILTFDPAENCTPTANPCTIAGGDAEAGFAMFAAGCDFQQTAVAVSDCAQQGCAALTSADFANWLATDSFPNGFTQQWTPIATCEGFCAISYNQDWSLGTTPLPVPVNITINFSAITINPFGTTITINPLFSSVVITE